VKKMKTYKIMEKKWLWMGISLAIIAVGLVSLVMNGLNWGIDFAGGNIIQYDLKTEYNLADARSLMDSFNFEDYEVRKAGDNQQQLIIRTPVLTQEQQESINKSIMEKWNNAQLIRIEKVDAVIGKELQRQAVLGLVVATVAMLIYITFRFEFHSAVAAVLALIHDVLIIISLYAVFRIPVNTTFIAIILTIVGYSINDTIVIFDRIRENIKLMRKTSFNEIANFSITQSLNRSINTSLTTLLSIIALYIFGGETIKDFMLTLIIGILAGTYSSIFIASPLWGIFRGTGRTAKA